MSAPGKSTGSALVTLFRIRHSLQALPPDLQTRTLQAGAEILSLAETYGEAGHFALALVAAEHNRGSRLESVRAGCGTQGRGRC